MRTKRNKIRLATAIATGSLIMEILAVPAANAGAAQPTPAASETSVLAPGMSGPANLAPLLNPSRFTTTGRVIPGGGCEYAIPTMSLAPKERAIEVRQVGVNPLTCTTMWEKGTPTEEKAPDASEQKLGAPASPSGAAVLSPSGAQAAALNSASGCNPVYSGSGYFRAWITDPINITLTSDQSNISFSYDYNCVQSASGSADWTWHGSTGWEPPYNDYSLISQSCYQARVWSGADFRNTGFCWPVTTYNHYKNVDIEGRYDGYLLEDGGSYVSWDGSCAPLYIHFKLVRTTG